MPIRPMPTVVTSAMTRVEIATSGRKLDGSVMIRETTYQGRHAARRQREDRGGETDQHIFQREGGEQRAPGRAERLQHHGVVDAGAVSCGERAGQHQHGGDECHAAAATRIAVPSCPTSRFTTSIASLTRTEVTVGKARVTALRTRASSATVADWSVSVASQACGAAGKGVPARRP